MNLEVEHMNKEEKIKMFKDIFAPKSGEKVLFLYDTPHDDIKDNDRWKEIRVIVKEWYDIFKEMGLKECFKVDIRKYPATGLHNTPIPDKIIEDARNSNLVIIMTEFSASSSLIPMCRKKGSKTRGATMLPERRMERTAFRANYTEVKKYAKAIKKILEKSIGADIDFSTGDKLYMDLRNRLSHADVGECTKAGQAINFPSGEAFQAPYEGVNDEVNEFGKSKTEGVLPVSYDGELVRYIIKNNRIVEVKGEGNNAQKMRSFFNEKESRKNIAELGIGCNPNAVVSGNVLEDEKVGLHIAYGLSCHFGGKVDSDVHLDIVYAKGCPVEGKTVTLISEDGSKIDIIKDSQLRYELLK
jgi:hypothetical protein